MKDSLGDRMKTQYENRTRYYLPRRTYTIIRVDGKAFHSLLKHCGRPFDLKLMNVMNLTALHMCKNIEGAKFGYVQSDEISILLNDFNDTKTEAWFDGNIQKICSISASIATQKFNELVTITSVLTVPDTATFDSRVFTIPDPIEVRNYFIWRQQDAVRNSIQMAGQAYFSHKELNNLSCNKIQEKLFTEKNINWNDYPIGCKRGRSIVRKTITGPVEYVDKRTGNTCITDSVIRSVWEVEEPPTFTTDSDYIPIA